MDMEKKSRRERLQRMARALINELQDPDTLLERVKGLKEIDFEFRDYYKKSDLPDEQSALNAYLEENENLLKRKTINDENPIKAEAFHSYALNYLENLLKTEPHAEETDEDLFANWPESEPTTIEKHIPLTLEDLWDGLLAYSRFRASTYLEWHKSSLPKEVWKKAKRKGGALKRLTNLASPIEALGFKECTRQVEALLDEYRSDFRLLAIGYLYGNWWGFEAWRKKAEIIQESSGMLESNNLWKLLESIKSDPHTHQCTVERMGATPPRFHSIALPAYAQWVLADEAKDENLRLKKSKIVLRHPPFQKK
jgi:hypothetical protein